MSAGTRMAHLDAAWLHMESPTHPMVITGVLLLDSPLDEERFAHLVHQRLVQRFPRFRQRVARGSLLAPPRWVEDTAFSLSHHLRRVPLPAPGGRPEMEALVARCMSSLLDFSRPLWEVLLVEQNGQCRALVARIHHSIADGISLARVLLSLVDEHTESLPAPAPEEEADRPALPLERLLDGARSLVRTGRAAWKRGTEMVSEPIQLVDMALAGARGAAALSRVVTLRDDPPSPLRGPLGTDKRATWSHPVPLEALKAMGRATRSTLNDVALAAAAGALRRYLLSQRASVEDLRAIIPVNLRDAREPLPRELGNRFGLVFLDLPLSLETPLERLAALKRHMDAIKRSPEAVATYGALSALGLGPAPVERAVVDALGAKASLLMTNVPGPRHPVYLAGSRVAHILFWVPQSAGVGLGLSLFSYQGHMTLGVAADVRRVPDPHSLAEAFHEELQALAHDTGQPWPPPHA